MNYFAPKPIPVFDFFTTREGETIFPIGIPDAATTPMRRVLDAAHPQAARLMVAYLQTRYKAHCDRLRPKRAMAAFLTWLDAEQIGLWQAADYDLHRYFNSLTSRLSAEAIKQQAATIQGFFRYLHTHL